LIEPIIARIILDDRQKPTPSECSMMLIQLKVAREISGNYPRDYNGNEEDIAGYANVLRMVKEWPDGSE